MKASNPPYSSRVFHWAKDGITTRGMIHASSNDSSRVIILATLFFTLFLLLLVTVWIHIGFVHLGYQVAHLKQQERKLKFENRGLKLQEEYLLSHPRLQSLAKKKFHLTPLTPEQVFVADEKGHF